LLLAAHLPAFSILPPRPRRAALPRLPRRRSLCGAQEKERFNSTLREGLGITSELHSQALSELSRDPDLPRIKCAPSRRAAQASVCAALSAPLRAARAALPFKEP